MELGEEFPLYSMPHSKDPLVSVGYTVYKFARNGVNPDVLRILFENYTESEISQILCPSELQCSALAQCCPPLVVAARKGNYQFIKLLIDEYRSSVNLEVCGKVVLSGYDIEGATALWCAAGSGHFDIVKLLVESGADVNRTTSAKSTPLRAACFEGRLDIVSYLVSHNADVNIANKFNNTCLMISAYRGHNDIVRFLLDHGAKPNSLACCGASALHFAAETGNLAIVKELVEYGKADTSILNDHQMTPLMTSAERCQDQVFQYLLQLTLDQSEIVDALELIGASFANDKENYDIDKAYYYLKKGMVARWKNNDLMIAKKTIDSPIEAYNYHVECQTLEELESIKDNLVELHMEGLAIRERILGKENPEVPHPIIFRGAVFADQGNFNQSIRLWMHALNLKQAAKVSVAKDVLRFAQVFCQMMQVGVSVTFEDLFEVLESASNEFELCLNRLSNPAPKDDPETHQDDLEFNMTTYLYLIVIFAKVIKDLQEEKVVTAMRCIHKVAVVLNPRTRKGRTLLHQVVDSETSVDDFHTNSIVRFPCPIVTKLLIEAGADVCAMDIDRNTPLHIIVGYQKWVADFMSMHAVITHLLDAGAHVDVVNKFGKTPMELANSVAETILRSHKKISLKCLCAQAVKRFKIPYQGHVPDTLITFVDLHGL